jgi:predicted phage terminase large subunit-like protein
MRIEPRGHLFQLVFAPGEEPTPEAARAIDQMNINAARASSSAFMEYVFTDDKGKPFEQQWFHDEWHIAWDNFNRVMIIAPRDHAKTSNVVGRALWEIGNDPNVRIKIVCASDGKAKERLFEITQHIEGNQKLKRVFPELVQDQQAPWNAHHIYVKRSAMHRDATVEALGITSTATGGRADILIADDVVDRRNALTMPALRETVKQSWKSDWTNLLEPSGRIWYICTFWSPHDLSQELLKNAAYKILRYDIDAQLTPIWEKKWPREALQARLAEIKSIEFNRAFRNIVVDESVGVMKDAWIQYADLERTEEFKERVDHLVFFTSYDTAGKPTGGEDQDYSAGVTIAVDPDSKRVWVVDAWHDRISTAAKAAIVWSEVKSYDPFRIIIERAGLESLDEWVVNAHPELAGRILSIPPKGSKTARLQAETPLFEGGLITFSAHMNPERSDWDPSRGNLVGELLEFPFGKHDDMVDALSQALHQARRYFLDFGATGGQNMIDVSIGNDREDETGYAF